MDRAERRRQERQARKQGNSGTAPPTRTQPISPTEAIRLAETYQRRGRLADAYTLCRQMLTRYPDHAKILDCCGRLALQLGKADEAVRHLQRAVAGKHDFAETHNTLAIALGAAGRVDEAIASCERALRFKPDLIESNVNLGHLLKQKGDLQQAAAAYQRAVEIEPDHVTAHYQLGLTFHALDRLDPAASSLRHSITIRPDYAEAHYSLGMVLHGMKQLDEALAAYDQAIQLKPALLDNLFDVGKPRHVLALFERGDHAAALHALDDFLDRSPGQSCALALKAIALDETGHGTQARELVDFDHLIRCRRPYPPADVAGIDGLNQALANHIRSHPTLRDAPPSFSAHRGKATGELLRGEQGPARAFEQMIRTEIEAYLRSLPPLPGHPFIANAPRSWRLTMWGNIIESEGFQVPHIHPSGWLSGVYYVTLPNAIGSSSGMKAGWIEFGAPYWDIAHSVQPELKAIRPEEGLLLLFPSYFYHRTLPFESSQQRISIAFDVVPAR